MKKEKKGKNIVNSEDDTTRICEQEGACESDEMTESSAYPEKEILRPYGQKIGEGGGNLRGREHWFQQRTGKHK